MPHLTYNQQNLPASGRELREQLNQAWQTTSSLDDYTEVVRALTQYETIHQLSSAAFYEQFQQGKMGDSIDMIRWANKYEMYLEMKVEMEQLFDLLSQYAIPTLIS